MKLASSLVPHQWRLLKSPQDCLQAFIFSTANTTKSRDRTVFGYRGNPPPLASIKKDCVLKRSCVPPGARSRMMIRGREGSWLGLSTRLKLYGIRRLCSKGGENGGNKLESTSDIAHQSETETSVSRYDETYKKLDKLDFVTAAKILFTEPPKTNKFGFDWHVVQFIIVCLPSVAVYLVAQYARRKMKIMDAELGDKKRKEEEKKEKEEAEQKALEKEAATKSHDELMEMKKRLGLIEETIKDIVLEAKKPSGIAPTKTQEDQSSKLSPKEESKPEKEHKGNVQKPGDGPH